MHVCFISGYPVSYGSATYLNTFCYMCNVRSDTPTRFQCQNFDTNYTSQFHESLGPVYNLFLDKPEPITSIDVANLSRHSEFCSENAILDPYLVAITDVVVHLLCFLTVPYPF